ncbi:MAG TPA: DUF3300 domain-containing protein, partial [Methylophilaceae bacterium]
MAATYPLEVVQADRWLRDPNNAALTGSQLDDALAQQPWDPSVKSLVPFPKILSMMDNNLSWTEQLGDAFLANQDEVMDGVQRLRQKAQAAGKLQSSSEEVVTTQGSDIVVQPADPETVYVPVYDPDFAYGDWSYPDYPPDYFPNAFTGVGTGDLGFGWFAIGVNTPLWGWNHWDWGRHHIDVDGNRFNHINGHRPPVASGEWHHDPSHRYGVPYRNAAVSARFRGSARTPDARRDFRGYPSAAGQARVTTDFNNRSVTAQSRVTANRPDRNAVTAPQPSHSMSSEPVTATRSRLPSNVVVVPSQRDREAARQSAARGSITRESTSRELSSGISRQATRPATQTVRAPAPEPAFESFGRGADIRPQAQRGRESFQSIQIQQRTNAAAFRQQSAPVMRSAPVVRAAPVQVAPVRAAPAQAAPAQAAPAAPAGGGGGGGNRGHR